ncbi:Multidrug resistance efflux pump [Bosea sp. CRIB-10]|uniref:HlyD family secretion protein n=1 Tax=Bosea sp. CRIB-10 TaxID=378404 RepID=UPI0008EDFD06|nr:efflux RND transporter periplasmic adaptor subunit [Bosea sp. CRIB-10]SFC85655.1 Multidrug resistance efflux pump [Bosea sp. CRIB-10]
MIRRSLAPKARPDLLVNQARSARRSPLRIIYLGLVVGLAFYLSVIVVGPFVTLQSGGIVTTERFTVASAYASRVARVHVAPGDEVRAGAPLLNVESPEVLDTAAKLSAQKSSLDDRLLQTKARLTTVARLLPIARERKARARSTAAQIGGLETKGLIPLSTRTQTIRELYEAEREEATLEGEVAALEDQLRGLREPLARIEAALEQLHRAYADGLIRSPVAGIVSAKVSSPGFVARSGDAMLEILHGAPFVLAYLPTGRLYDVAPDMPVVVTDGVNTARGRIERIENVADTLPPEFQNAFKPSERQQVMRIAYAGPETFPVSTKVTVLSPGSAGELPTRMKHALASLQMPPDGEWLAAARMVDEFLKMLWREIGELSAINIR